MREVEEDEHNMEEMQKNGQDVHEVEDDDSLEWELRNTDSVFSELSEMSRDYVASVDQGASIRGKNTFNARLHEPVMGQLPLSDSDCFLCLTFCLGSADQFEEILSQYEELKVTK